LTITDCPCTVTHTSSLPGYVLPWELRTTTNVSSVSVSSGIVGNSTVVTGTNGPSPTVTPGDQNTAAGPTSSPAGVASTTGAVPIAQGGKSAAGMYLVGFVAFVVVAVLV
jgi:hypothetical protein